MSVFSFDHTGFRIDGKDSFMISGEFHYFRVPADDWKRRMELFREGGGNTIATYVPWLIHEPEEGNIVFGDRENRDLVRFLKTAKETGLKVILRPGPYQYSELFNGGLPEWLLSSYPEILARDIGGNPFRHSSVSYLHPVFLEKARKYYKAFADVVRPFIGDPVVMLQTDNELSGIHIWFGSLDYHPKTMGFGQENGRFPKFLQKKYESVERLNSAWNTEYTSFTQAVPAPSDDRREKSVCIQKQDYFDFYLSTLAEYTSLLASWLREDGFNLPICHNSANPGMNSLFVETVEKMGSGFLLGSDHYYTLNQTWPQNNPTPQYAVRALYSMETMRLLNMPPSVLEMPGGSPSDTPPILKEDLLACYMTNLAMGMKGVNYYIFTGGPNFPGTGSTCEIYDYNAFIRADGSVNPTYESFKTFNAFMNRHSWMQRGKRRTSANIAFEWSSIRTEDFDCISLPFSRSAAWDFAKKGVIYTMLCSSFAPSLADLSRPLDPSVPLIVPSSSVMSENAQTALVRFLENGGQALILGALPEYDENLNPCTYLMEHLGSPALEKPLRTAAVIHMDGAGDIYGLQPVFRIPRIPEGASVLFTDIRTDSIMGYEMSIGRGRAIYLSCRWQMTTFDQARLMEELLTRLGGKPALSSSNRNIFTSLIEDENGHYAAFIMNLYSAPQSSVIRIYNKDDCIMREETVFLTAMEVRALTDDSSGN